MKLEKALHFLKQQIEWSKTEQTPLDHILLCGSSELTQEVFSYVSTQTQVHGRVLKAVATKQGDLAASLTHLRRGGILYIDELQYLDKSAVPILCSAMQDFVFTLDFVYGSKVKKARFDLPEFTVLAASSNPILIPDQLHTLFDVKYRIGQTSTTRNFMN